MTWVIHPAQKAITQEAVVVLVHRECPWSSRHSVNSSEQIWVKSCDNHAIIAQWLHDNCMTWYSNHATSHGKMAPFWMIFWMMVVRQGIVMMRLSCDYHAILLNNGNTSDFWNHVNFDLCDDTIQQDQALIMSYVQMNTKSRVLIQVDLWVTPTRAARLLSSMYSFFYVCLISAAMGWHPIWIPIFWCESHVCLDALLRSFPEISWGYNAHNLSKSKAPQYCVLCNSTMPEYANCCTLCDNSWCANDLPRMHTTLLRGTNIS